MDLINADDNIPNAWKKTNSDKRESTNAITVRFLNDAIS